MHLHFFVAPVARCGSSCCDFIWVQVMSGNDDCEQVICEISVELNCDQFFLALLHAFGPYICFLLRGQVAFTIYPFYNRSLPGSKCLYHGRGYTTNFALRRSKVNKEFWFTASARFQDFSLLKTGFSSYRASGLILS